MTGTDRAARLIATVGGLGDALPAPGTTAGSLPAVIAWWIAARLAPDPGVAVGGLAVATVLASAVGTWAAGFEARRRGRHDPGPVVIDEVVGQWACILAAAAITGTDAVRSIPAVVLGFLAFRVLDIVKPWPIRRLERLPGGFGIMLDDVAAGVVAGLVVGVVLRLIAG